MQMNPKDKLRKSASQEGDVMPSITPPNTRPATPTTGESQKLTLSKSGKQNSVSNLIRSFSNPEREMREQLQQQQLIIETDVVWEVNGGAAGKITAASLARLIDYLTDGNEQQSNLEELRAFIISYIHYTSASKLHRALLARLTVLDNDRQAKGLEQSAAAKRKILRLCLIIEYVERVLQDDDSSLSRNWIKYFWHVDFGANTKKSKKLLKKLEDTITDIASMGLIAAAGSLTNVIHNIRSPRAANPPLPLSESNGLTFSQNSRFWQMSVGKIAQQITLVEHRLLTAIGPEEFLNQGWLKSNKEALAPNIVKATAWFNRISEWCASEILRLGTGDRVACIEWFIDLVEMLLQLNNFSSALQIVAALQRVFIQRLTTTWALVKRDRFDYFQLISTSFEPRNNWRALRAMQSKASPPAIPYLGTYLSDILVILESFPATIEGKGGSALINLERYRRIGEQLLHLRSFQQVKYPFAPIPSFNDWLEKRRIIPDADLYVLSELIQPRSTSPRSDLQCKIAHSRHLLMLSLEEAFRRASAVINPQLTLRAGAGRVYSWADNVTIDSCTLPTGVQYVYCAEPMLSPAILQHTARLAYFYAALHLNPICLRTVIATLQCHESDVELAKKLGVDVVVVNYLNQDAPYQSVYVSPSLMIHAALYRQNFNQWLPLLLAAQITEPLAKEVAARLTDQDILLSELHSVKLTTLSAAGLPDVPAFLSRVRECQDITAQSPTRTGSIFLA